MVPTEYSEGLISVICPARDVQETLSRAISSVLGQTFENWELVIINDGSIDETESIAKKHAANDGRISILRNEGFAGVAAARNLGLKAARGRWVAFLDADDEWLPEKLLETLAFAEQRQSPLTFTGYRAMSPDGSQLGRFMRVPHRVNHRQLLTKNVIATSSVLIDRAMTGPIEMRNISSSDFVCWLELLSKNEYAWGLSEDLLRYQLTPSSLSRNKSEVPLKIWKIYRDVENFDVFKSAILLSLYAVRSGKKYLYMTRLRPLKGSLANVRNVTQI